jgi:hypothetical protein
MDGWALGISILALVFSGFTFYWLNIRERKKLFLVRIDRLSLEQIPEFALVNGGSKDLLITAVECSFRGERINTCIYPAQTVELNDDGSRLLQAGKSYYCKIKILSDYDSEFVLDGDLRPDTTPPIYLKKFRVDVSWVESSGASHKASADICKVGFTEDGHEAFSSPLEQKHELYKNEKEKGNE